MISIELAGVPAPKGSMRAMMVRGRPMAIPGGSSANQRALNAWDRAVRDGVTAAIGERPGPMYVDVPLEVALLFRFERPSSHFGKRGLLPSAPPHPATRTNGDIDKLARATLDSLTGLLFDDDARIAVLTVVKQWGSPGCVVTVRPVPPLQGRLV